MEKEKIKGGHASGKSLLDIARKHQKTGDINTFYTELRKELKKGIKVELEHTPSRRVAKEIAMDHLWESPKYYQALSKMEKTLQEHTYDDIRKKLNKIEKTLTILKNQDRSIPQVQEDIKKVLALKHKLLTEAVTGMIVTDDPQQAEKLAKKGLSARLVKKDNTTTVNTTSSGVKLSEGGIEFSDQETRGVAREVGKSLIEALKESGEELSRAGIRRSRKGEFTLHIVFKTGVDREYDFYLSRDRLFLQDVEQNVDLVEVGIQPSGEVLVNRDVLKNELLKHFKTLNISESDIERYILETYVELLREQEEGRDNPIPPEEEEKRGEEGESGQPDSETGAVLADNTQEILEKFPTLKKTLVKLMTREYEEFVESVDWISPKPTAFRVNLVNGQDFELKWMGKDFNAQVKGKKYYLGKVDEFQQALDKLSVLYKEGPTNWDEKEVTDSATGDSVSFGGEGGGGDFPGAEPSGGGEGGAPAPETSGPDFGEEPGGESPEASRADLSGEEIDFEEPAEEPK